MLITSKDNSRIKEIRKLLNKKYSIEKGLFVIEGENLVEEAIKSNLLVELYVLDGTSCKYNFKYDNITLDVMKSISDLKSTPRLIGVSKYINKNNLGNKIVLLDGVQDPGNAGTIIRNCVAFGVDTIVFSKDSVSPYNEKVLRSTGGMIYNINIIIDEIENIVKKIKEKNIKLIGTSLSLSKELEQIEKSEEYAIIFGNEGNGVSKKILDLCDDIVRIDMENKCESLNVGVSSGIILYYMYKR
ncbi:MAG: RNA methyltransferase [bacterium]|nr:RNA methyltransferase [bacterium]